MTPIGCLQSIEHVLAVIKGKNILFVYQATQSIESLKTFKLKKFSYQLSH